MDEDRNDDTWAAHRRFAPLIPSVLSGIKRLLFAIKTVYLGSTSLFWEHVLRNVLEGKRNKRHLMLLWFIIKKNDNLCHRLIHDIDGQAPQDICLYNTCTLLKFLFWEFWQFKFHPNLPNSFTIQRGILCFTSTAFI